MKAENRNRKINRILVALDDSSKAIDLLHAAADLALELEAELIGLFVEDVDLLNAADLPIFRDINLSSRTRRKVDRIQIERVLHQRVTKIRAEVERIRQERPLDLKLTITRGTVANEIQKAAADADMVIMSRSTMSSQRLGSTAHQIAGDLTCNLLLIEPSRADITHLLTIYDGSEKARRALSSAALLADAQNGKLTIAVVGEDEAAAQALKAQASQWLHEQGIEANYRWLLPPETSKLKDIVESEGQCLLILPDESSMVEKGTLREILPELKCEVFLVS
jgi:nucleotide-binding universal stress UspA family protein